MSPAGVPQPGLVPQVRFAALQEGPAEVAIRAAIQIDQVHVDFELADIAVHARGAHGLVFQPLGILTHEGELGRQGLSGCVENDLVELGHVGVDIVPSLAVACQIDAGPVVDGPVRDGPGHRIVERLLRRGVGFRGTRGQKADPGN